MTDAGHRPFGAYEPIDNLENPLTPGEDGAKAFPHTSAFAGDDGSTPPELVAAFGVEHPHRLEAIVDALREARLLIPVVAKVDKMEDPEYEGQIVGDKESHAAMVTVETQDGRAALPVFTSVEAMATWREDARPVPTDARKAALAAGAEADSLLVLDPGTDHTTLITSHAVAAIATGEPWSNPLLDTDVHAAVAAVVHSIPNAVRAEILPGSGAEIRIVLALKPGLDRVAVVNASQHMSTGLGASEVITSRIDSLELRITTAQG